MTLLSKESAINLYRKVYLIRAAEEAIRKEYPQNDMKTPVHLCNGSEAIAAGVISGLPTNTKVFGTYRNHGLYLGVTEDTDGFFAELYGKDTGCAHGLAGSMHLTAPEKGLWLTSAVVATTIPVAVGAAFAGKYKNTNEFAVVFFGDGAMEEGIFWESLNFACLHELPVLLICENNELAIHASGKDRRGFKSIDEVVKGFRCHSAGANGYSPMEVLSLTVDTLQKMKAEPKPAFLRLDYFRLLEHVGINEDFSAGYREKPNQATYDEKDPVIRAEKELIALGVSVEELSKVKEQVDRQILASIEKAKSAPLPKKESLYDYIRS